jgi:predicted nucleotidyltransferase component of viral defense system
VITKRELELLRAEWSLDLGVIEKDYVLGWLLAGIAQHDALASTWVFKGAPAWTTSPTLMVNSLDPTSAGSAKAR